jgi:hypothetical protein
MIVMPQFAKGSQRFTGKLFVEIGPACSPVFKYGSIKFGPDHVYADFDVNEEFVRGLREAAGDLPFITLEKVEPYSPYPVPDGAADTVYIGNVFGIPDASNNFDLHLLYQEGVRMTSHGGHLIILETSSPWPKESMEGIARRTESLSLSKLLTTSDPEWPDAVGQYNWVAANPSINRFEGDEYFLVAEKT